MRNGFSVEVFRVPPGETGEARWDVLNDGLGYDEAIYQFDYLREHFKYHKIRVMRNFLQTSCVKDFNLVGDYA